jgi:hypothetical protein
MDGKPLGLGDRVSAYVWRPVMSKPKDDLAGASGLPGCVARLIEKIACAIVGHRYVIERVLNKHSRKVGCTRCESRWGMHDPTRSFVRWDSELEAFYAPGGILAAHAGEPREAARPDETDGSGLAQHVGERV